MPSVCCYFQVHQPFRIRNYTCFDMGRDHFYFDDPLNIEVTNKVAAKCYIPANRAILDLIRRHDGRFRVAYSITGVAIEQMIQYCPEALESFVALSKTGCVEFLGETYYHSLASIFDPQEFRLQVRQHQSMMEMMFGQRPSVFRNTELICNNAIMRMVGDMGYHGLIAEGADDVLQWRTPDHIYNAPGQNLRLLLKNYNLSDDIAFRFSNQGWHGYPLNARKYAGWLHSRTGSSDVINLFMDYETFGEHQWESTGIFRFLDELPGAVLSHGSWDFATPSETIARYPSHGDISFPRTTSWADKERDLSAWQGNRMQNRALALIYSMGAELRGRNNPSTLDLWRKLQTSDHFYYMCTKFFGDNDVHSYFSHHNTPYEAFMVYMNILADFQQTSGFGGGLRRQLCSA